MRVSKTICEWCYWFSDEFDDSSLEVDDDDYLTIVLLQVLKLLDIVFDESFLRGDAEDGLYG